MIAFDGVEKALRQRTFGTLSTLTEQGEPHATGVVYAVSARCTADPLCDNEDDDPQGAKPSGACRHRLRRSDARWAGRNVASTAQMTRQRDGAHDRDAARCGGLVVL
jgi:hypothetical protein